MQYTLGLCHYTLRDSPITALLHQFRDSTAEKELPPQADKLRHTADLVSMLKSLLEHCKYTPLSEYTNYIPCWLSQVPACMRGVFLNIKSGSLNICLKFDASGRQLGCYNILAES